MAHATSSPFLVIAAVEAEIEAARKAIARRGIRKDIRFVTTGVGKANAARATALALREHTPRLCVQVGSAGAFPARGLSPGDVVMATEEIFADEGARTPEGFLDLERLSLPLLGFEGRQLFNRLPVCSVHLPPPLETLRTSESVDQRVDRGENDELSRLCGLLQQEFTAEVGGRFAIRYGPMATVSTISGTAEAARELRERWAPLAEAMEGAAAALCCILVRCPFQEIRGISNFVGDRDRTSWDIPTAIEHAAEVAAVLLESAR